MKKLIGLKLLIVASLVFLAGAVTHKAYCDGIQDGMKAAVDVMIVSLVEETKGTVWEPTKDSIYNELVGSRWPFWRYEPIR